MFFSLKPCIQVLCATFIQMTCLVVVTERVMLCEDPHRVIGQRKNNSTVLAECFATSKKIAQYLFNK